MKTIDFFENASIGEKSKRLYIHIRKNEKHICINNNKTHDYN